MRRAGLADERYQNGLVPQEDMGTINVGVQTSPGSSLEETDRIMDEIEAAIPRHSANPDLFARYGQGHPAQPVVVGRIVFRPAEKLERAHEEGR